MAWKLELMTGMPPDVVRTEVDRCEDSEKLDALYKRRDELQKKSLDEGYLMSDMRYGVNPI